MTSPRPFVVSEADCEVEAWDDPVRGAVAWRTLISGDRTPTEALTLGVAVVSPGDGGKAKLHRHTQVEAYYVLAGEGVLTIDGVDHPLAPGVAAFIPGGSLHGARAVGAAPLRILYVFAADAFGEVRYEFPAG